MTDDIFAQQGYPHFRLGAPDKSAALAAGEIVFPDTGDVSYLLIEGAYLELVELAPVGAVGVTWFAEQGTRRRRRCSARSGCARSWLRCSTSSSRRRGRPPPTR